MKYLWIVLLILSSGLGAIDLDKTGMDFDPVAFRDSPQKDGFKAIFDPVYLPLQEAAQSGRLYYLPDDGWLLQVSVGRETRLYPLPLMNWHHIANESFSGEPVGVSYCLLTGSSVAFTSRLPDRKKSFAVAGSLFNSNLIMYDKQTGSLWPQLDLKAHSGVEKGKSLDFLPLQWVRYGYAKRTMPNIPVLVGSTEYKDFLEMYNRLPGEYLNGYDQNTTLIGPVVPSALADKTYFMKEMFILFPEEKVTFRFQDADRFGTWVDTVSEQGQVVRVSPKTGRTFITLYWFAVKAFFPEAKVLTP